MLEYVGQRDDPGHERRCTALLAALAWTHCQFGKTSNADIESVRRDLTQHLARSRREGQDAEVLADALADLCLENSTGGPSTDPSPAHVQLASAVLATRGSRIGASKLLGELIGSMPERHEGQGGGVDALYRSALCAWVAIAPPRWDGKEVRAVAKDRILDMTDGKLNLRKLQLYSLPELPAGLTELDVSGNDLTELPALPASLATLDASENQLTQLPALPAGLTTLAAATNLLTCLPALPAGLTALDVNCCDQLTELPPLPEGLTELHAGYGGLRHLPALPGSLTTINVSTNWLTELPLLPANLDALDTSDNKLSELPPSVFDLPHASLVLAEINPFSPAFLQQLLAVTSAPGYRGPRIRFSSTTGEVSIASARALPVAILDWFSNDEQAQLDQWQEHIEEAHAAEFFRFLDRLRESVNYNADFKAAVASWLSKLAQDRELRQLAILVAQAATERCEDRVTLTYNDLTKLSHARAVARGEYDARLAEIVDLGRGAFRLDALEKIAHKKAQALQQEEEEIEVHLAYQVQLRDRLKLPTDVANMGFFEFSRVTPQDLRNAEQEILAQESTEFPQYFLVEWAPWRQVLARLDPEGTERARQKLHDMLPAYDQEVAARQDSLGLPGDQETHAQIGVGIMKAQQLEVYKELTWEFLCKRGEEALMDRIMGTGKQ
ncbi:hypothetical protein RO07_25540 [Pandoraea pulmonicola]|uniref:NEL domain-containing protein n=1 Tax=Pandoraea pulmonicola TaxID=93221 RepID=A0ABM6FSS5_PANPU|nr:hypothetical protein RO07_25540 [Pandoraea pulmonicola]